MRERRLPEVLRPQEAPALGVQQEAEADCVNPFPTSLTCFQSAPASLMGFPDSLTFPTLREILTQTRSIKR